MNSITDKPVIFLMGPTASGKTDLAIDISNLISARLISVDSALIYKGMDIGTAKPNPNILHKHPHYLVDILNPDESYSAYEFTNDAKYHIEQSFNKKQTPLLVGGTSFYFNALEHGLSQLPESTKDSRETFNLLLQQKGSVALHNQLYDIDAIAAKRIHKNDSQRITRALEVHYLTGKTITELQGNKITTINNPIIKIILMPDRDLLHERIEHRFLKMIDDGFLEEVENLYKNPKLHENLASIRCVGYRQAWQYLNGQIDRNSMIEKAIIATRQLCKRQCTWLKSENDALIIKEIDPHISIDYIKEKTNKLGLS
ncbi:MAG: tRNA (adenosine(37)-N6)-dimethylallyltransferase MiaA [PS1 clade bacterium]|jgi:tRNA dimethylallyltransferase